MRQGKGAEAPLALERAATRGAVFALKSALLDEFWAGKLTMRGADEVQSCTLISMLCDGAPIGVQEGVWVSLTRNLSRHSPPPWGEVAQKGKPSPAKLTVVFFVFIGSGAFPGPGKAPEQIK